MDNSRSSSNSGIYLIVILIILAVCGYKWYQDKQRAAAGSGVMAKQSIVAVSQRIEPTYDLLFSELNKDKPLDLVPTLTIMRARVVDKQSRAAAERERQDAYNAAIKLIDGMIVVAEERTQALGELMKIAAQPPKALENYRMEPSNQHFLESQKRRSTESIKRKKPGLDTLFSQLQTAEKAWNAHQPSSALTEKYNFPTRPPVITLDYQLARQNPLEQQAYGQTRIQPSWRQQYYDENGFRPGSRN
jgi:hypothetical protein